MTQFLRVFSVMLLTSVSFLSAQQTLSDTNPMASKEIDDFRQQMQYELTRANDKVNSLVQKMKDHTIAPMWTDKLELQNAIIVYDTKSILVSNFKDNPVIQSPVMRNALLNTLRSDSVTEADLAYLQSIANQVRANMQTQQTQTQQPQTQAQ